MFHILIIPQPLAYRNISLILALDMTEQRKLDQYLPHVH